MRLAISFPLIRSHLLLVGIFYLALTCNKQLFALIQDTCSPFVSHGLYIFAIHSARVYNLNLQKALSPGRLAKICYFALGPLSRYLVYYPNSQTHTLPV